ncbi:ATP-binding cassette domain-containing protein [Brucepastera parasyntrophica]|uniref:methionine ABC transporter ATP-binding protein n=1 Tax=Brucepastera parasyntrophica TaxID=2880008 RepID=UPI0021095943|nr:ATP-binding cassette domain-containing protein [Brucepastera parasyntrophica]ULQ60876.1 ATP-binding cassette domain-containing protein [Brucepastera parasyntrophica]
MISLENLKKRYGEVAAVDSVSLEIPSNTIYGIIGKSGAGKSTLVRLISLLERPDSGEILFSGKRVDNLTGDELIARRRRIGMIFQNFNLFSSRSAAGNIAYPLEIGGMPRKDIRRRVSDLLEHVGLEGRGDSPISTLSGGQKQRVAVARALAVNPDILFCDEATSALDPQTTRSILDLLKKLQRELSLSIVMITHQMEVVRDACELVAVLDEGRVVEEGRVTDIFARPKAAITREFLSHLNPMEDEDSLSLQAPEGLIRWSHEGGAYTIRFRGELTGEPVLSRLSKQFNIEFNIRAGGVQNVSGTPIGTMIADISGDEAEINRAIEYLSRQGVTVEKNI